MNPCEQRYESLRLFVDRRLRELIQGRTPREVTDACRYVLSGGGKRVRSVLVLLACEAVGGGVRAAIDAGIAMELMHNFTLVHDDIMDRATSRRGRPAVHTKWGSNNALLVGDILLGLAFKQVLKTRTKRLQRVLHVFTAGLLDVCEGQALDVEFERRSNVSVNEYFVMIRKKTARLISTAAGLGGLVGKGTENQIISLQKFGDALGRAFQLQDDLLDVVADEKEFGKRIGGDILEGKKTFLLLKALEQAKGNDRKALLRVIHRSTSPPLRTKAEREREVNKVARIYESSGAIDAARKKIREETHRAQRALQSLPKNRAQETLYWLSQMLLTRSS